MQSKALDDICTETAQHLIINENELHHQATAIAEEAHSKSLREVEERLKTLGEH